MKTLWARVGMAFEVSDANYEIIKEAIKNGDSEKVGKILFSSRHYPDGETYLPSSYDCEENPNDEEFKILL